MKRYQWLFVAPLVLLCFVILFSIASEKTRKRNAEVAQIHHAAEKAIGDYLKGQTIKEVSFNSLPIFYDKDRGMIGCRALWVDEQGEETITGFGVLLRRGKTTWNAAVVDIIDNPPTHQKINPAQEGR